MTQQVFADYIGQAPATISGIFNGRTRPTLNVVEAIKKKIPNINTDWLVFGSGEMYITPESEATGSPEDGPGVQEAMLDFDSPVTPIPQRAVPTTQNINSVRPTRFDLAQEEVKYVDKPQRKIMEIRVFYDDQTFDIFTPAKK